MDILEDRDYCLSLPFVEESTPFDETTLVFKVGGRMFTYAGMEDFRRLAVKCDPDEAVGLRERYEGVEAAWHGNKRLWNDLYVDRDLSDAFVREQIRRSYMSCGITSRPARCATRCWRMSPVTAFPNNRIWISTAISRPASSPHWRIGSAATERSCIMLRAIVSRDRDAAIAIAEWSDGALSAMCTSPVRASVTWWGMPLPESSWAIMSRCAAIGRRR